MKDHYFGILKRHATNFLGLGITVLFLALCLFRLEILDRMDLKFYDVMMNLRADAKSPSKVVLVDIDNDSIDKLGSWPWPRSLIAKGIRKINSGRPRVIGLNLILSEPEDRAGLRAVTALKEFFVQNLLEQTGTQGQLLRLRMLNAEARLDSDKELAESIMDSGKVVLPILVKESEVENGATESGAVLIDQSIRNIGHFEGSKCRKAGKILLPLGAFLEGSSGIGHISPVCDMDGKVRRERLLYEHNGLCIPSFTLRLAALYLNVSPENILADLGSVIYMGSLEIPVDSDSEVLVGFKGPAGSFESYSYFDVINNDVSLSVFKDKLVLLSASAARTMEPLNTPTDSAMSVGEFSANSIWAILNRQFVKQPYWGFDAELAMILVLGLVITFVLPRLKIILAGITFLVFFMLLIEGSVYLFVSNGLWVRVTYPFFQLVCGYVGLISIRHFVPESSEEDLHYVPAETDVATGRSLQVKGMPGLALDKFRTAPLDDNMKDILYNLALDYERKSLFAKAAAVYEHIEAHDGKFKDVRERKKKLVQADETMVLGDGDAPQASGSETVFTLGRYNVIRQLSKGAMGTVFLGQDPRIKRTTAIKAFRFTDDFGPEEAGKMKENFFFEAKSAGTLSHPNIVTIYDAGEEQDLAYIAMEYLEGESLQEYTKKENLLPMRKVIEYVAAVADALDYAHAKGIVHRDVKPANIMLANTGVIKITDFGIARITTASQTRTGVVKGTPHYMSPEQISGEKVDGRSDIFSLGVVLFELLAGERPFSGDNLATLMHQIVNVPHTDPKKMSPRIVKPLGTIINKALEKDREKRYQKASQLAAHLRELNKAINAVIAKRRTKRAAQ
ncbi:MAG: CHASE2 domain-containing protein [Desulfobacterales bacterium]|nr:CHASE2 domain-containing protein [Desulfobacterales bacterium]